MTKYNRSELAKVATATIVGTAV